MREFPVDDRPRLFAGAKLEKTKDPGVYWLTDPRTGTRHNLRRLDALVAHSCNGTRTLPQLFEVAQKHGSSASSEMIADVVRKLKSLGVIEQDSPRFDVTSDDLPPAPATPPSAEAPGPPATPPAAPQAPRLAHPLGEPDEPEPLGAEPPPIDAPPAPPPPRPSLSAPRASLPTPRPSAPPRTSSTATGLRAATATAPRPAAPRSATPPPAPAAPPRTPPPTPAVVRRTASSTSAVRAAVGPPKASVPPRASRVAPQLPPPSPPVPPPAPSPPIPSLVSPAALANAFDSAYDDGTDEHTVVDARFPGMGGLAPQPVPESEPAVGRQPDESSGQIRALESLALPKGNAPVPQHSSSPGGSKLPWVLLAITLLGGGGAVAWFGLPARGPEHKPEDVPMLRIESVRADTRSGQSLVAAGFLSAPNLILIGATTAGRIKDVKVVSGAKVAKNQVLILLDDAQFAAELQLAKAKVRAAQRTRSRAYQLFKAEAATQSDLDNAIGQAEIANAEATVIEQRLQQTKVRSPIEGTILEVPVHPGEVINAGDPKPLIKLADLRTLVAEIDVNEADAPMARIGQTVEVQTDAVPGKVFEGAVREISQQVDKARGTVLVKVDLKHPGDLLRPGLSVKATLRVDADAAARILLPRSALDSGSVWRVTDGKADKVPVSVQAVGPSMVEVVTGLKVGDRVVIEGFRTLRPGQKVE